MEHDDLERLEREVAEGWRQYRRNARRLTWIYAVMAISFGVMAIAYAFALIAH